MKKLLFVLAVFCYTATFVSAQVETMEKVVNAVDELSPAAKAAAADASIVTKSCGPSGKVCYMKKAEGTTMNVVNWDVEKGAFVNVLDKEGKQVTCDANAKTCSKEGKACCAKGASKSCSKGAKKSCSKSAAKSCSHAKGAAKAKTCSHGAKTSAKSCAPGCTKACCASDAKVKGAHSCEPGCTKACCAKS